MKFSFTQRAIAALRRLRLRLRKISFGNNVYIGRNCAIDGIHGLKIGDNVYIGKNVTIEVEGRIGSDVLIANNVGIVGRTDHGFEVDRTVFNASTVRQNFELSRPVYIGSDVWIGFGAVVLSGIKVGDGAIIAAGSVVRSDVEAGMIVAGNPAVVVRRRPNWANFVEGESDAH